MTFQHFVAAMRHGWLLIVSLTVIGAVVGAVSTAFRNAEYDSTVSVLISPSVPNDATELAQGASYVSAQMDTYAALVDKNAVLDPVARAAGGNPSAEELGSMVSIDVPSGSTVMDITVTSENPEQAARLANSVPGALQSAIGNVVPPDDNGNPFVRVIEVEQAAVPSDATSPGPVKNGILGALVGFITGVLIAMIRYVSQVRAKFTHHDQSAPESTSL